MHVGVSFQINLTVSEFAAPAEGGLLLSSPILAVISNDGEQLGDSGRFSVVNLDMDLVKDFLEKILEKVEE